MRILDDNEEPEIVQPDLFSVVNDDPDLDESPVYISDNVSDRELKWMASVLAERIKNLKIGLEANLYDKRETIIDANTRIHECEMLLMTINKHVEER